MTLQTWLTIAAATFGVVSGIWLSFGTFFSTQKDITARLAQPWKPGLAEYEREAVPIAQYSAGVPLLLASFGLQIAAALVSPTTPTDRHLTLGGALDSPLALVAGLALLALAISAPIYWMRKEALLRGISSHR